MTTINRSRLVYGVLLICVLGMGLLSRHYFTDIVFVQRYAGDVLWALMVFVGFALLFTRWPTRVVALAAILFSYSIEISQLYHAPWIDGLRNTRLGGLVLGFSFLWSDLLCYSLGVAMGMLVETYAFSARAKIHRA